MPSIFYVVKIMLTESGKAQLEIEQGHYQEKDKAWRQADLVDERFFVVTFEAMVL